MTGGLPDRGAATPDWPAWEERIARLLPAVAPVPEPSPDRPLLLDELSMYGRAVVREARRAGALAPNPADRERSLAWLARPIFVCGHFRSGTTLMSNLLDGHPELVVLPNEGTYFSSFPYALGGNPTPDDVDRFAANWVARFVDASYARKGFFEEAPHFRLGRANAAGNPSVDFARRLLGWHGELLRTWPSRTSFALLLALVAAFHDVVPGASRPAAWVEKTPLNERYVARITAALPDARFIQLVREPRATMASLLELYRSGDVSDVDVGYNARQIGASLKLALRNARRLRARYLVVRYEDLVGDTQRTVGLVRDFLGLSPSQTLGTPTVLGVPVRPNTSFGHGAPGEIRRSRSTRILSGRELALIDVFAASSAPSFGYEVVRASGRDRALLLAGAGLRYALRGLRSRLGRLRNPA